ncbi:MAG TPA: FAD-dependent oxidoreductase [Methylomirabilota bacterium]|nr:FAD-dependent oxidoreductase [Methylomirabilota bacterium]
MSAQVDIVVVGSGAAGIAAAVTAARTGANTLLMDRNPIAGGTGGFSGLTTLCGLHTDSGQFLNDGFAREFAEELLREDNPGEPFKMGRVFVQLYRPESFQAVAARLLANEARIQTQWNTSLNEVIVRDGLIQSLNGLRVGAVIDCTGTAEVGRTAGEELLVTDETTQSPAVIFKLENVERDLRSPIGVAMVLLHLAHAGLPPLSFMPCVDPGTVAVKFSGPPAQVPRLLEFLQQQVSGFERCRTPQTDFTVARRSGAMIVGRYVLTGDDVLRARKFPDAVARGSWPVEQWSADGRQSIRYLPPGEFYEIPAGALHAARTENLFMAGKSLSADIDAIASARVIGCCLATGAAAGKLAAESLTARTA